MKKKWTLVLASLLLVIWMVPSAMAGGKKDCDGYGHKKGLSDKVIWKACYILDNEEKLGLSDSQYDRVKDLKYGLKKDLVRQKADIKVLAIDIKKMLWADTIDTDAIDDLVDQKYTLKAGKTKMVIGAYAQLKDILSEEQCDMIKKMIEKKKEECKSEYKKGSKEHHKKMRKHMM